MNESSYANNPQDITICHNVLVLNPASASNLNILSLLNLTMACSDTAWMSPVRINRSHFFSLMIEENYTLQEYSLK